MRFVILLFLMIYTAVSACAAEVSYSHLWGGFATSLVDRSPEQRGNAGRAAIDLNGFIIAPAAVFSFNDCVGARDTMKGYVPAPIINDRGGLDDIPGGGICQLATTIYNAALEAGLEIVERHPHSRSVGYVSPGRDATILTWRKDLKLRNPHAVPLLLRIALDGDRITAGFWSVEGKDFRVTIVSDIIPLDPEAVVSGSAGRSGAAPQAGGHGFSALTKRITVCGGKSSEEILSRDFYPPPSRIIRGAGP